MNYQPFSNEPLATRSSSNKYNFMNEFENLTTNNVTASDIYKTSFVLLQKAPITESANKNISFNNIGKSIENLSCNSEISKIFFSDKNIKRIQQGIRRAIYIKSGGKYKMEVDQDPREIVYVMRAIFIEHAKYIPNQIVRQVKKLNILVVDEVLPSMMTSIRHNQKYLSDANQPLKIMDLPINVNNAGRKTLPGFNTIWEF